MHALAQVIANHRIGLGDARERPAYRFADGDPGALALVGEGSGPAAETGGDRELADQPVTLGELGRGALAVGELVVELAQPAAVVADRGPVQHRLRRGA